MQFNDEKYRDAVKFQEKTEKEVVAVDEFSEPIGNVCGVDVSYGGDVGYCSAVIVEIGSFKVLEAVNLKCKIDHPYIPGLFFLREQKPIMDTIGLLKKDFDLILIDGHGQLHPRRCGLACTVGVSLQEPTIGVAKNLLCGTLKGDFIEFEDEVLGIKLGKSEKPLYISVGHRVMLKTAKKIVEKLIRPGETIPFPLLIAHRNSKALAIEDAEQVC